MKRAVLAFLLLGLVSPALATSLTRNGLTVTYRDPADRPQVAQVFRVWAQAKSDLEARGLKLPATTLISARSAADFAALTGAPANIAALTRDGTVYTQRLASLSGKNLLPLTLRHEAFHLAQPPELPRWLAEGLARIFSGEAQQDAPSHSQNSQLAALTNAELSERLSQWSGAQLSSAYREAARRASRLLARQGWAPTLATRE